MLAVTALGSVSGGVFWTGAFFLTRQHYRFTPTRNLLLAFAMGTAYAFVAWSAGRLTARLERQGPRRVVAIALALWALAAALPLGVPGREAGIWVGGVLGSGASGAVWPVIESYLGAGRHGADLRQALGRFNVTWTLSTAVPLLVFPWLIALHPLGPLAACAVTNLGAVALLSRLPRRPAPVEPEAASSAVGGEYPALLRASRWLLPQSYLFVATLAPVLPHRLATLGAPIDDSVMAATWMLARFGTLVIMARVPFWHGRWGALVAAGGALLAGVALALLSSSLGGMVLGLVLLGAGMGLTYYASLYYSLAVGHAAVDAGGGFEALIGVGYMLGPVLGLAGRAVPELAVPGAAVEGSGTVLLAWVAGAVGAIAAGREYLRARRLR
ncbi:MAG TPA: MFS transporter [Polyangiaceae bacterium]|nr:MFS transporter [Polyangiaceae bacterium]